jgi:hypothetical protein
MLEPCAHCQRHIDDSEVQCPFCGTANHRKPSPRPRLDGRLSRAAVFASAALVAPACVVNDPPPQYPYQQQPPPNYQQQQPPPNYQQPPPPDYQQQPPDYAQPPPNDQQPPPPVATAGIHVVVRYANGQPYVGPVELHGTTSHTGSTNANGELVLRNLPPGTYTVVMNDGNGGARMTVELHGNQIKRVSLTAPIPSPRVPDYHHPKPYGAPPARKRVV